MIKNILFFILFFSTIYSSPRNQSSIFFREKINSLEIENLKEHVEYHDNGNISVKGSLIDGIKFGFWYFYDKNGKLREERTYINGDHFFSVNSFSEKEFIISNGYLKDSLQNGEWNFYDEKGILLITITFKKGIRDGKFVAYSPKGHPIVVGTFKNNELLDIISIR